MNKQFLILSLAFWIIQSTLSAQVLDSIMWITDGEVQSIAVDANDTYIGGNFTYVGPNTGYGGKLTTTNTSPDMDFPKVNGTIYTAVSDGNNGWYIGGTFTKVGKLTRNRIAHIKADKTVDVNWNPNVNGGANAYVRTIAISGSDIYVGGYFTSIGGQTRNNIAKLNNTTGSADASWNPNANNSVQSIAISGNDIYVAGEFLSIGGQTRVRLAKLNNTTGGADANWNPNANSSVLSVLVNGNDIYIVGGFWMINGQTRNHIAKLNNTNGNLDESWNPDANGTVNAIVINSNDIYVGGSYTSIGGQTRNNIAKLNNTNGNADVNWNPNAIGGSVPKVNSITISGSDIYVGGIFTNIGGQVRNNVAKLNIISGNAYANWDPNTGIATQPVVHTISINGTDIYIGGNFISIGGFTRNGIAKLNNVTGKADSAWNPNANGGVNLSSVLSIAISGTDIFVGGNFTSIGGQLRNYIAKLNATTGIADANWDPNVGGGWYPWITSMNISGSYLYVGGWYTNIGGQNRNNIAKLNITTGNAEPTWNPDASDQITSIALNGNDMYVGGYFTSIGGVTRNRAAKLNANTGIVDGTWNPNANNAIFSMAIGGSDIYIGGAFTSIGGQTRNYIAKVNNSNGGIDAGWNPDVSGGDFPRIQSITLSGSDIYVGGIFTSICGQTRNNIAKLNNTNGCADASWNPNILGGSSPNVYSLYLSGSDLYIGGSFTNINDEQQPNFARLLQSGVSINDKKHLKVCNIEIYPNPTSNKFTIDVKDFTSQNAEFEICNINGQEILKKQITADQTEVDITNWKSGIYFVKIITGNSCEVKKIVKE